MTFVRQFGATLWTFIRILVFDGWRALFQVALGFLAPFRTVFGIGVFAPGRRQAKGSPNCIPISHPAFKVPDPMIYSQYYLMGLGFAVTWNNPDIVLRKGGAEVSPSKLEADTDYEIVAQIWNNSLDAPVVDLPVSFSYLSFGIGTMSHPITAPGAPVHVTLGVRGGLHHPAYATAIWRTPAAPGHYCIQVKLDPHVDANYANNLGQTNTQVAQAASPAEFSFVMRNNSSKEEVVHFKTDTYYLPEPPPCGPGGTSKFDPRTHSTALYPIPPGWTVVLTPNEPVMAPAEERTIAVEITPPDAFSGAKAFNINAYNGANAFLGGVTLYVTKT
jgi:hypothetical protein